MNELCYFYLILAARFFWGDDADYGADWMGRLVEWAADFAQGAGDWHIAVYDFFGVGIDELEAVIFFLIIEVEVEIVIPF
jgi:hypothetical protein